MAHLIEAVNQAFFTNTRLLADMAKHSNLDNVVHGAIRVVILGAVIAALRKFASWASAKVGRALFPSAYIHVNDHSFQWIMAWLAQDPYAQRQIKDFQLSTAEWRSIRKQAGNALASETNSRIGDKNATWSSKEIIGQVIPTYYQSIRIKHQGQYLWISRRMGAFARTKNRTVDHLQIRRVTKFSWTLQPSHSLSPSDHVCRTLRFHPDAIKNFLVAAHQAYFSKEDKELLIFHAMRIKPAWQKAVVRPSRPWSSVILPETVKEKVLSDIERFLSDKETSWYAARGIPHRRGYLFHGEPGSGKTTLATAIASKLSLDIYIINPAQRGMDDAKLSKLFRDCPSKSIILIEDIDCVFPRGRGNRSVQPVNETEEGEGDYAEEMLELPEANEQENPASPAPVMGGSHDLAPSTVTLSGLLNAIDGVSSQEGCVLIASTNYPERLDPALARAGRFDVRVPFHNAVASQAKALFLHFYPLDDFLQIDHEDLVSREKGSLGITSQQDLEQLADDFTEAIFPTRDSLETASEMAPPEISMAALQGYLLQYKEDPKQAAENVSAWKQSLSSISAQRTKSRLALPGTPVKKAKGAAKKKVRSIGVSVPEPEGKVDVTSVSIAHQ